ncbi:MAG: MFS transporter [Pirellulaceae bacterium]|nr:MFS transporter [Pirellulaceae bacterium]
MLSRTTLKLVLLVSCAHALVHVFELSLPSVEQEIDAEFECGVRLTGLLGTAWRFPWGAAALLAGWLVDRYGSRSMLTIYLLGCATMCVCVATTSDFYALFLPMIGMGTFASIYHPAGLSLISQTTTPKTRPFALGIHGVFGSLGIGGAPLMAGLILSAQLSWRTHYWLLIPPTLLLAVGIYCTQTSTQHRTHVSVSKEEDSAHWWFFGMLVTIGVVLGITYSAFLHFLPRYLSDESLTVSSEVGGRQQLLAGGLLFLGCIGQYTAGHLARHRILEWQLSLVMALNVPCLIGMAFATGWLRALAAGTFALCHFMHQPLYNSLIAKYTPVSRRSLCYGFSFTMGLGIGGIGPTLAGFSPNDLTTYLSLALATGIASGISLLLAFQNKPETE